MVLTYATPIKMHTNTLIKSFGILHTAGAAVTKYGARKRAFPFWMKKKVSAPHVA